VEKEHRTAI